MERGATEGGQEIGGFDRILQWPHWILEESEDMTNNLQSGGNILSMSKVNKENQTMCLGIFETLYSAPLDARSYHDLSYTTSAKLGEKTPSCSAEASQEVILVHDMQLL